MFTNAWNNKGSVLYNLDRADEALDCYDKALDINSRNAEVWNNKGSVLYNLDRADEALDCYDEALGINPQNADAWYNKGAALLNLSRTEEAILAFQKFIKFAPLQYVTDVKKIEEFIQQLKGMV